MTGMLSSEYLDYLEYLLDCEIPDNDSFNFMRSVLKENLSPKEIYERMTKIIMLRQNDAMLNRAKELVVRYFNEQSERTDNFKLTKDDVFVVWFCKTLQNWKALASTTVSDGMYYEITHNGDKNETYLDAYKKWKNVRYPDA